MCVNAARKRVLLITELAARKDEDLLQNVHTNLVRGSCRAQHTCEQQAVLPAGLGKNVGVTQPLRSRRFRLE